MAFDTRRTVIPLAMAAAVTLFGAGCAEQSTVCSKKPASPRVEGVQLPVKIPPRRDPPAADLTDKRIEAALPPAGQGLLDQVEHQLMSRTVFMAGALGDVRAGECKAVPETEPGAGGSPYRCTVTYEGIKVVWKVRLTATDGILTWFRYEPVTGVLTAKKVYEAAGFASDKETVWRCDPMPDLFPVLEAGKPTLYRCQQRLAECNSDKGGWRFRWETSFVSLDENGNVAFVTGKQH